MFVVLSEADLK